MPHNTKNPEESAPGAADRPEADTSSQQPEKEVKSEVPTVVSKEENVSENKKEEDEKKDLQEAEGDNEIDDQEEGEKPEPKKKAIDPSSIISTPRPRKQVNRFSSPSLKDSASKRPILIVHGKGKKLGEIPAVNSNISARTNDDEILCALHRIIFNTRISGSRQIKHNLREFSGLVLKDDKEKTILENKLHKFKTVGIKELCEVLNIDKSGDKMAMVDRLIEFLQEPRDIPKSERRTPTKAKQVKADDSTAAATGDADVDPSLTSDDVIAIASVTDGALKQAPAGSKITKPGKGKGRGKGKGKGKGKEDSEENIEKNGKGKKVNTKPRAPSAYNFFVKEVRPGLTESNKDKTFAEVSKLVGDAWSTLAAADREKYIELAKAAAEALPKVANKDAPKAKVSKKESDRAADVADKENKPKKRKAEADGEASSAEGENIPDAKKKKDWPSVDELRTEIDAFLQTNIETLTKKKVRLHLENKFGIDLVDRKQTISTIVNELIQEENESA